MRLQQGFPPLHEESPLPAVADPGHRTVAHAGSDGDTDAVAEPDADRDADSVAHAFTKSDTDSAAAPRPASRALDSHAESVAGSFAYAESFSNAEPIAESYADGVSG